MNSDLAVVLNRQDVECTNISALPPKQPPSLRPTPLRPYNSGSFTQLN
jgi:hypothetical protein